MRSSEETNGASVSTAGKQAPRLPGRLPIVGNTLLTQKLDGTGVTKFGFAEIFEQELKEQGTGPIVAGQFGPLSVYLCGDPDMVTEACVKKSSSVYTRRFTPLAMNMLYTLPEGGYNAKDTQDYKDPETRCPVRGLVNTNGSMNKRYRDIALHSLNCKNMRAQLNKVAMTKATQLASRWRDAAAAGSLQQGVRVDNESRRFTVDVITEAAFGVDLKELSQDFTQQDKVCPPLSDHCLVRPMPRAEKRPAEQSS